MLIQDFFENQVLRTPCSAAVVCGERHLSYAALNARANQMARWLQANGVGPDMPVGCCIERSVDTVVAVLAILKAGACYLPLDPAYPPKRLALMAHTAGLRVLLTQHALLTEVPELAEQLPDGTLLCIDRAWPAIAGLSEENLEIVTSSDSLLYLLFTSGSTGAPKAVAMPHAALTNLVLWQQQQTPISAGHRTLQFTSLSFDVSAQEIFATLCFGGTLVLVTDGTRRNPEALWRFLESQSIDRLFLPFVALQGLAQAAGGRRPAALRDVITAGEQLQITPAIAHFFSDGICRLHNQYGPTETHVVAAYTMPGDISRWAKLPPIGRPVTNVSLYILDDQSREVAVGQTGELHVAGVCLARGYYGRPDLTSQRFMPNPFGPGSLYKTGDLCRLLPDRNIEFLGRVDHQVKIRGFRVELAEIELTLKQHRSVLDAVANVTEGGNGQPQVVLYVVPNRELLPAIKSANHTEHLANWRQVWDAVYSRGRSGDEAGLDHIGWKNSYTGRPVPTSEMDEWADTTAKRILTWRPRHVLEVGCGTGMLLRRIVPYCSRYVGTDISAEALGIVKQSLSGLSGSSSVTLRQLSADNLAEFGEQEFDTIVVNSVVELFPDIRHLMAVLEEALRVVQPGGRVFIGDVRSLFLRDAFYASTQLSQAPPEWTLEELRKRITSHQKHESRLFVDPEFFGSAKFALPRVSQVQIQLRRGKYHNEMTKFRYDVLFHVATEQAVAVEDHLLDWQRNNLTLSDLCRYVTRHQPPRLRVSNIPNARLMKEARLLEMLNSGRSLRIADVHTALRELDGQGIDPELLWACCDAPGDGAAWVQPLPYLCHVTWPGGAAIDRMEAVYVRRDVPNHEFAFDIPQTYPTETRHHYSHSPLRGRQLLELEAELRRFLSGRLPDYMVPSKVMIVDDLPTTPSGKVNRGALPHPVTGRPDLATPFVAPKTEGEHRIAATWCETLKLETVGIDDNFFQLGGDSLLLIDLHERLVRVVGAKFPVAALFDHPTIRTLARYLQSPTPDRRRAAEEPPANETPINIAKRQRGVGRILERRQRKDAVPKRS